MRSGKAGREADIRVSRYYFKMIGAWVFSHSSSSLKAWRSCEDVCAESKGGWCVCIRVKTMNQ